MFSKNDNKNNNDKDNVITVKNVSKHFKIPHEKKNTVYENIIGIIKGNKYSYEEFWALQDINFTVKRGEVLGIIGENGSGKSTLLKIIAGVLYPDSGTLEVNGRIAPFLELGVGFQPELTAEDNVYLYGSVMGIKKEYIKNKIDNIFEFAELEKFRNAKLKNYSSGMYARLAFSIAISTDPDIILIDEALAVGDETFQKKCLDKFNEFKRNGMTIIFVSHALETVKEFCDRSILLNKGRISSIGYNEKVINNYRTLTHDKEEAILQKQHDKKIIPEIKENMQINRWGSREIEIKDVQFYNESEENVHVFKTGDKMIVRIKYYSKERIEKPVFGVAIHRNDGIHINGTNCKFYDTVLDYIESDGELEYIISSIPLLEGTYLFTAAIYDYNCVKPYDHHERKYTFKIIKNDIKDVGMIHIPCEWKYNMPKYEIIHHINESEV